MVYARLYVDPHCERPAPPPGFQTVRCGVEIFDPPDGCVSRPGETCEGMLGRVAAGVRLMAFLYATDGATWVTCHWTTPAAGIPTAGMWSGWETCSCPDEGVTP